MRRVVIATLLASTALVVCAAGQARAQSDDPWTGADKTKHFGFSAAFGATAYTALWLGGAGDPPGLRVALAGSLAVMPGLFKEIYDAGRPGNRFSGKDMLYNVAGAIAGTLVVWLVEQLTGWRPSWSGRSPGD